MQIGPVNLSSLPHFSRLANFNWNRSIATVAAVGYSTAVIGVAGVVTATHLAKKYPRQQRKFENITKVFGIGAALSFYSCASVAAILKIGQIATIAGPRALSGARSVASTVSNARNFSAPIRLNNATKVVGAVALALVFTSVSLRYAAKKVALIAFCVDMAGTDVGRLIRHYKYYSSFGSSMQMERLNNIEKKVVQIAKQISVLGTLLLGSTVAGVAIKAIIRPLLARIKWDHIENKMLVAAFGAHISVYIARLGYGASMDLSKKYPLQKRKFENIAKAIAITGFGSYGAFAAVLVSLQITKFGRDVAYGANLALIGVRAVASAAAKAWNYSQSTRFSPVAKIAAAVTLTLPLLVMLRRTTNPLFDRVARRVSDSVTSLVAKIWPPKINVVACLDKVKSEGFWKRFNQAFERNRIEDNPFLTTTLDVFLDGIIEEGCTTSIVWPNSTDWCADSLAITLKDGNQVYRVDCLNTQQNHFDPIAFKKQLNELTEEQRTWLRTVCLQPQFINQTDLATADCFNALKLLAVEMRHRFWDNDGNSVQELIHDRLKNLFRSHPVVKNWDESVLSDIPFMQKMCRDLIVGLLQNVTIRGDQLVFPNDVTLYFGQAFTSSPFDDNDLRHVSLCHVNDLTSPNGMDYPFITDEALHIAKWLQNNPGKDVENCPQFKPFSDWILNKYYAPFCSQLVRAVTANLASKQRPLPFAIEGLIHVHNHTGDVFDTQITQDFTVTSHLSENYNCFFTALTPDKDSKERHAFAVEMRRKIADHLLDNRDDYVDFVNVVGKYDSADALKQAKYEAIEIRAREVLDESTFMMELEFEIAAKLIKCPIYVYNRDLKKFFLDPKSKKIMPHTIYGVDQEGSPRHLKFGSQHYTTLTPK